MKRDHLFYRLFQALPQLALELAELDSAVPGYEFRSEEVKQTAFRLDGILLPPAAEPTAPLIFVEVQAQADEDFYGRFFSEIFLYLYRARPRRPWRAIAIYPTRKTERADDRYATLLTLPEVRRVYLTDWARRPAPTLGLQLIQILLSPPASACQRASRLAEQTRAGTLETALAAAEVLDLIETIVVYRLPHLTREEIQTMLGLTEVDLKQSRFYQDVLAEGRQEGEAAVLLRLLALKFGPPEERSQKRILSADAETLLRWSERLLTARSLDEVLEDR